MTITKEQVIRYIGKKAGEDRYYGTRGLPPIEDLCERHPEHQSAIRTAYGLLRTINQEHGDTKLPSGLPVHYLVADAENIHRQFVRDMPFFFGLPPRTINPLPIRFEDIKEKGLFSFERDNLEIILNSEPATWHSHLDFLFTVAHESAHYLHYLNKPAFYEISPI